VAGGRRICLLVDVVIGKEDVVINMLGQKYIDVAFGADAKKQMAEMVDALEKSLNEDIQSLDWMGAETKKQANVKLQAIRNKIGYFHAFRDYS